MLLLFHCLVPFVAAALFVARADELERLEVPRALPIERKNPEERNFRAAFFIIAWDTAARAKPHVGLRDLDHASALFRCETGAAGATPAARDTEVGVRRKLEGIRQKEDFDVRYQANDGKGHTRGIPFDNGKRCDQQKEPEESSESHLSVQQVSSAWPELSHVCFVWNKKS